MFRAPCAHHQRSKLYYTASGIITPIGVMIPEAVEACNKLIVKQTFYASWLITKINIYSNTHGDDLRFRINKYSKVDVMFSSG